MAIRTRSPWPVAVLTMLVVCVPWASQRFAAPAAPSPEAYQAATSVAATFPAQIAKGDRTVTITKSSDGLFYVSAQVNGTPVRFLLDTGANMVVLTQQDAQHAGVIAGDMAHQGRIDTASGASAVTRVRLQSVRVAGQEANNIEAAVMAHGLKVSLLGQNMLARLGTLTLSGNEMALRPAS